MHQDSGDRILQLCIENRSAVAVEGARVELIAMSPQPSDVTWLPKMLHWMHDRSGAESQHGATIAPYQRKYVAVVQQFGDASQMCVIPDRGVMVDDPLLIPFQRYTLTVQATAHNSTPVCKRLPIVINQHNLIDMFFLERCESRK